MITVVRTPMDALTLGSRPCHLMPSGCFIFLKPCYCSIHCTDPTSCGLNEIFPFNRFVLWKYVCSNRYELLPVRWLCSSLFCLTQPWTTCQNPYSCPSPYRQQYLSERYDPSDLPIGSQRQLSGLLRVATSHVPKREEYGDQWRDIHDAGRFPFTPHCR